MTEQWIRWEPISGLADKYEIESISDTFDRFTVILSDLKDEEKKVKVTFEGSVDAYRAVNESFRLKTFSELHEKYGVDFYGWWTFFKVADSEYLKWLSEQSYGISDAYSMIHFSFFGVETVLDVLTNYEPKVELIEQDFTVKKGSR